MANSQITFHYHTFGVSLADYNAIPSLNQFFKLISTDQTAEGETFLTALEANGFSIYALMYHPEYQLMNFVSDAEFNIVNNPDTRATYEHLGKFIYQEAIKNRKRNKALIDRVPKYKMQVSLEGLD